VEREGKIFVFSAPSGAGKSTIIKEILRNRSDLVYSISATTRSKRDNEVDGVDYFFISEDEFKQKIERGEFIEWEQFYDYYYGTLKSFVDQELEKGNNLVLELDVKGALSIKKIYKEAVLIFIQPPSIEELKQRLEQRRTETEEDFQKRIDRAEMELAQKDKFDYRVLNVDIEKAKQDVNKIIDKEINKEKRYEDRTN
jgi:guanylate kinase